MANTLTKEQKIYVIAAMAVAVLMGWYIVQSMNTAPAPASDEVAEEVEEVSVIEEETVVEEVPVRQVAAPVYRGPTAGEQILAQDDLMGMMNKIGDMSEAELATVTPEEEERIRAKLGGMVEPEPQEESLMDILNRIGDMTPEEIAAITPEEEERIRAQLAAMIQDLPADFE